MIKDHMEIIAEHGVTRLELSQLRMQALQMTKTSIGTEKIAYNFELADKFVHFCLTGEHKLPEKKG